ncbi:MAG TPA: hypothetical protein DCX07_03900 [Phycisphaerales bacterium]|nr:hypothetical protein [Phycisphaerales bacterium]
MRTFAEQSARLLRPIRWLAGRTWFGPAVLGALLVAVLGGMLLGMQAKSLQAERADLAASAGTARECIHQRLDASRDYLRTLAQDMGRGTLDEEAFQKRLALYLVDHPELVSVVYVDASGTARWTAPSQGDPKVVGLPLACPQSQQGHREAIRTGQCVYSPPHVGLQGEPAFDINVPILRLGEPVGGLVGVYSCERVLRHVLHRDILQKHQVSLVDERGNVIVPLPAVAPLDARLATVVEVNPPGKGLLLRLGRYGHGFWGAGTILLTLLYAALVVAMIGGMWSLKRQILCRRRAEQSLREARDSLALRVRERTSELERANEQLHAEMAERRRAEERARQRQEELARVSRVSTLGEMAAGLAHELNQPLGAIASFAEGAMRLLESHADAPEQIHSAMTEVRAQALRAGNIVHRLRDFVSKGKPRRRCVELCRLVEEVVDLAGPDLRQERIALELDLPRDLPPVLADPVQIQQVLLNLLRNSLEAIRRGSDDRRIALAARAGEDSLCRVSVADTGPGCPPGEIDRLCTALYTTKPEGIGMGLSISRTIVEAHHGRLWIEPNLPAGLVVHFTLPLAQGACDDEPPPE